MNELTLAIKQNPGSIELNFDALEEQLDKKLAEYKGALFTEDTKAIAKSEVASLRRLKKDIEDGRKAVKKKWMEPYDQFEKRMKTLSAKVDEPINAINEQVQAFEEKRKQEKREEIRQAFEEIVAYYDDLREYISFDKLYNTRWENASAAMKSVRKDIVEKMEEIQTAVSSIKAMRSDKEPEALDWYRNTLDLGKAIQLISTYEQNKAEALRREEERRRQDEERKRLAEIERIRVEERARIRREEEIRREEKANAAFLAAPAEEQELRVPENGDDALPFEQPSTKTVFYKVVVSSEEMEQVEMAFNSIGIVFERMEK